MATKSRPRAVQLRRLGLALALPSIVFALVGCALPGGPEPLDAEQLASISARVSEAQPGLDALLRADSRPCEGLCQRVFVGLSPRSVDYTALDIGLAIYETDVALEERQVSAFEYCFDWRSWPLADAQYLDARLGEVRGLGYGGVLRDADNQSPAYDCYSFASLDGPDQLLEFLRENGAAQG